MIKTEKQRIIVLSITHSTRHAPSPELHVHIWAYILTRIPPTGMYMINKCWYQWAILLIDIYQLQGLHGSPYIPIKLMTQPDTCIPGHSTSCSEICDLGVPYTAWVVYPLTLCHSACYSPKLSVSGVYNNWQNMSFNNKSRINIYSYLYDTNVVSFFNQQIVQCLFAQQAI